ncbi:MAG: glycerophosphoryl diester phosphodiesterase membrane domain-containing protein [Mycobacteriales bacterium]
MGSDPSGGYWGGPPVGPPGPVPPYPGYPPPPPPPGYPPPGYPPPGYGPAPGYPPNYGWPHGGGGWGAPQAPKPGIIPLRPLGVGELLDGGFAIMRRNPAATLGLSAALMFVVQAVQLATSYYLLRHSGLGVSISSDGSSTVDTSAVASLDVFVFFATLFTTVLLGGMLTAVAGPAVLGRRASASEAWQEVRPQIGRLAVIAGLIIPGCFLAGALPGLALAVLGGVSGSGGLTALGVFLAVVGGLGFGLYLAISFAFATPIVVLEKQPIRGALRRSHTLVKVSWWRVFGIILLGALIAEVVAAAIGFPFQLFSTIHTFTTFSDQGSVNFSFTDLLISGIGGLLGATVARPFAAGVTTLLYIDQRMRREALDLTLQQASATPAP